MHQPIPFIKQNLFHFLTKLHEQRLRQIAMLCILGDNIETAQVFGLTTEDASGTYEYVPATLGITFAGPVNKDGLIGINVLGGLMNFEMALAIGDAIALNPELVTALLDQPFVGLNPQSAPIVNYLVDTRHRTVKPLNTHADNYPRVQLVEDEKGNIVGSAYRSGKLVAIYDYGHDFGWVKLQESKKLELTFEINGDEIYLSTALDGKGLYLYGTRIAAIGKDEQIVRLQRDPAYPKRMAMAITSDCKIFRILLKDNGEVTVFSALRVNNANPHSIETGIALINGNVINFADAKLTSEGLAYRLLRAQPMDNTAA